MYFICATTQGNDSELRTDLEVFEELFSTVCNTAFSTIKILRYLQVPVSLLEG